jgi:hypothetical protein
MPTRWDLLFGLWRIVCGVLFGFALSWLIHDFLPVHEDHVAKLNEAERKLAAAETEQDRFYRLGDAAKHAVGANVLDRADRYANELLALSEHFATNWNYGNAIHDGNMVLGRIALRHGNVEEAKRRLFDSGNTPGSPQLN